MKLISSAVSSGFCCWGLQLSLFSQDKSKAVTVNGYITTMQSAMFDSLSGPVIYENLLHNRLNFKGFINKNITVAAEFRNRLFTGDMVRAGSSYADMIGTDQGWIDMSWNIVNTSSFFINTTIDRLWLDLNYSKLQVRIGRQRINWGQTLVWNPNDILTLIHSLILIMLKDLEAMQSEFNIIPPFHLQSNWQSKPTILMM